MTRTLAANAPLHVPFRVVVDSREQLPYTFGGLRADADKHNRPLEITRVCKTLPAGDYSIEGFETRIAIERKSLADLFSTLGQRRDQFEAEHARLARYEFAAVVIEASWSRILFDPPGNSRLLPKTILRTGASWSQRYGVHWLAYENRRFAEIMTFRHLETFWKNVTKGRTRDAHHSPTG